MRALLTGRPNASVFKGLRMRHTPREAAESAGFAPLPCRRAVWGVCRHARSRFLLLTADRPVNSKARTYQEDKSELLLGSSLVVSR